MKKKLLLLTLISINYTYTQEKKPTLRSLNVLTMREGQSGSHSVTTIDQLIRHINKHNEVPIQTHIDIDKQIYSVYRGIQLSQEDTVVAIFSRGYAKTNTYGENGNFLMRGACALSAYIQFKDAIVTGIPLISFDYDDSKNGFSFGQQNAVTALKTVYDSVLAANPEAHIILIGDCRGGKAALELLTQNPKNLAAVILMAPFTSARQLSDRIAENHLPYLPLSKKILHTFFQTYFTKYDPKQDTLASRLHLIDPSTPILIAHRDSDTLVSNSTIAFLEEQLKSTGNEHVHSIIVQDRTFDHSMLTGNADIRRAINQFLHKYGLPHHPDFVEK